VNRRTSIVATLLLSLVVTACANQAPGSNAPASTSPSAAGSAGPSAGASTAPSAAAGTELERAKAGEFSGTTVEVMAQWIEAEGKSFDDSLKAFRDATGINVVYSGISNYETVLNVRVEGGLAPDVGQIAQPGTMRAFQQDGKLIDLATFLDIDQVKKDYNPSFVDLGTVDDKLYGLFYKQDLKSIVWYPVKAFAEAGYTAPTTWEELIALSDKIVADGKGNPWCVSMEHKDASGWVATDWLEDILLRTAGAETYDKWVDHEIAFDDPAVLKAAEYMKQIWFTKDYVYGGNTAINATFVGDTQSPMFDEAGPKCWMHKQAAWIPDFWPKGADEKPLYKPGVDSSFFYFPEIDPAHGKPVLGGGDMFVAFNDRPEVRAFVQWLATTDAVKDRVATGSFLAANNSVPAEWYTSYPMSGLAEIARTATALRFDASDSMPKEVGSGSFWKEMVKWVSQNGDGTEQILAAVEASWP
jgi:alpha-glucoside transport system substrate-binding protein